MEDNQKSKKNQKTITRALTETFNSNSITFDLKVDKKQCEIPKSKTNLIIPKLNMDKINRE